MSKTWGFVPNTAQNTKKKTGKSKCNNALEVMGIRVSGQTDRQTDISLKKNTGQKWENSQQVPSIRKKLKCKLAKVTESLCRSLQKAGRCFQYWARLSVSSLV